MNIQFDKLNHLGKNNRTFKIAIFIIIFITLTVSISFKYTSISCAKYKPIEVSISKFKLDKKGVVSKKIAYKKTNKKEVIIKKNKALFSKMTISKAKKLKKGQGWFALSDIDSKQRARRTIMFVNDNMFPPKGSRKSLYYNPPGWNNNSVNIEGKRKWFYNRTHLLGFQLSGLNSDKRNLITGAIIMNTPVMVAYENAIKKYVKNTDNGVLYEVMPIYRGDELVARGVQLRAKSIDLKKKDKNKYQINIYLYNKNPGWTIDYKTGEFTN